MNTALRINREMALELTVSAASVYIEMLSEFQKLGGWAKWPEKILQVRKNLKIENYHALYDNELAIGRVLCWALMGKERFDAWNKELDSLPQSEQQLAIERLKKEADELDLQSFFPPQTEEECEAATAAFNKLSEEDKQEATRRTHFFYAYLFSFLHNALAVVVHGEKLTSLVARAKLGNKDAFCKAIQIDRGLLSHHPFFSEAKAKAQNEGDEKFLADIAYREKNPTIRGKIRFPELYAVFSLLETLGWLDDFKHSEILDICDRISIDRTANRIADESYVSRRLKEYRNFQKSSGLSMY